MQVETHQIVTDGIRKESEIYYLITCRIRRDEKLGTYNLNDWDEMAILVPSSTIESGVEEYFVGPHNEVQLAWNCVVDHGYNDDKSDDDVLYLWKFYKTCVQKYEKNYPLIYSHNDIYYSDQPKIITKMWYFDIICTKINYYAKTFEETLPKECLYK
jgi:hypothetical protein